MDKKLSPWINDEYCAYRIYVGTDQLDIKNRVAFIEKTPRVRIREDYLGTISGFYEDGGSYTSREWPEFLDWCERSFKGDGPDDLESRKWCDNLLIALGYELGE